MFENTWPPPEGQRVEGQAEVRAFWERFFRESPHAHIEIEDLVPGDGGRRVTMRWRYRGGDGHVRGVDVYRVRDGLIAEKLSYVKG